MKTICAFTSVCQEDDCWVGQYLDEMARLRLPFAMHFDRCLADLRVRVLAHPLCVGTTRRDDPDEFNETHKQAVFNLVQYKKFDWAFAVDIDETFDRDAAVKLQAMAECDADYAKTMWVNLWGDKDHIRVDGPFDYSMRVKGYNLKHQWKFDHPITNGCKAVDENGDVLPSTACEDFPELVCLHHGMMTRELREQHKARWDRIYTSAVGGNPYKFWDYALNEAEFPPVVVPNPFI